VICCYSGERLGDLLDAVDSVQGQTRPATEIAVVVDHNPALLEHLTAERPELLIVPNTEPVGLSGARNSGIAATTGEIVAFLDDDAVAEPDWLEHLMASYESAKVAGVGGSIHAAWQNGRPRWFPVEFDWVVGCTYRGLPLDRASVRNLIGANMSFRREVFETAGGFAVDMGRTGSYPLGNDDTEFCIRARKTNPGTILLYEPRARVRHKVPATRSSWDYFTTRCFAEGQAKAALTKVSGTDEGLASERSYVARTLPSGFAHGLGRAARGDTAGARRSLAILTGLAITTAGYGRGRVRSVLGSSVAQVDHARERQAPEAGGRVSA
jgi:GT2 family glycosyltransferase